MPYLGVTLSVPGEGQGEDRGPHPPSPGARTPAAQGSPWAEALAARGSLLCALGRWLRLPRGPSHTGLGVLPGFTGTCFQTCAEQDAFIGSCSF